TWPAGRMVLLPWRAWIDSSWPHPRLPYCNRCGLSIVSPAIHKPGFCEKPGLSPKNDCCCSTRRNAMNSGLTGRTLATSELSAAQIGEMVALFALYYDDVALATFQRD